MNSYTITEAKVRTVYTIQIGPDDMVEIAGRMAGDLVSQVKLAAYGYLDPDTFTDTEHPDALLRRIWSPGDQWINARRFIAQEVLGFDGVENDGYFDGHIGRAVMTVYRAGDRLNGGGHRIRKGTTREPAGVGEKAEPDAAPASEENPEADETPPPEPARSIAEVVKAAAAAGMSYGEYVQATEPRRAQTPKSEPATAERKPDPVPDRPRPPAKGKRQCRTYTDEEKAAAVRQATSGGYKTLKEAADRLGIPNVTLYKWVKEGGHNA